MESLNGTFEAGENLEQKARGGDLWSNLRSPLMSSQTSSLRADSISPQRKRKTGLKRTYYSKDHFSSRALDSSQDASWPADTRLVVKLIEAKNLLASDVETGKSDPLAFVWCCSNEELKLGIKDVENDTRIQRTGVVYNSLHPRWNAEFVFPLDITAPEDLFSGRLVVVLKDEDAEDGQVSHDPLGWLTVPFTEIFARGVIMKSSLNLISNWYPLQKSKGMLKVSGSVRMSIMLFLGDADLKELGSDTDPAILLAELQSHFKRGPSPGKARPIDSSVRLQPEVRPTRNRGYHFSHLVAPPVALGSWTQGSIDSDVTRELFDESRVTATDTTEFMQAPVNDYQEHDLIRRGTEASFQVRSEVEGMPKGQGAMEAPKESLPVAHEAAPEIENTFLFPSAPAMGGDEALPSILEEELSRASVPEALNEKEQVANDSLPSKASASTEANGQAAEPLEDGKLDSIKGAAIKGIGSQSTGADPVSVTDELITRRLISPEVPVAPSGQARKRPGSFSRLLSPASTNYVQEPLSTRELSRNTTPDNDLPVTLKESHFESGISVSGEGDAATTLTNASKLLRMSVASKTALLATKVPKKNERHRRQSSLSTVANLIETGSWKKELLESFSRLERSETFRVGFSELRNISLAMTQDQAITYLKCLKNMTNSKGLKSRIGLVKLMVFFIRDYPEIVLRYLDTVITFLLDRVHDPESAMREPCILCTSVLALHVLPSLPQDTETSFTRLVGPLFAIYSEQSPQAQESSGSCLAVIGNPMPSTFTLTMQINAKSVEEAREALAPTTGERGIVRPPRDLTLYKGGLLILDFPSISEARTFYVSRSVSGSLPPEWVLNSFSENKAMTLTRDHDKYVNFISQVCPRFLHQLLANLKARVCLRGPLFQAINNLATLSAINGNSKKIRMALSLAVAPAAERVISCLKDRKKEQWKERVEAMNLITGLARCYDCIHALAEVRAALLAALGLNRSDPIKLVRDACQEAIAALQQLPIESVIPSRQIGKELERDMVEELTDSLNGGPPRPAMAGDMELPEQPLDAKTLNASAVVEKAAVPTDPIANHKTVAIAAGNSTTTVRVLKEINRLMMKNSAKFQIALDKLSKDTSTSLSSLGERVQLLEQSFKRPSILVETKQLQDLNEAPIRENSIAPSNNPKSPGTDAVNLWRELMWLIHSGQVETAYERVLIVGTEKDLLRLMSKTSVCLSLLSPNTKDLLFSVLSKIMKGGGNIEYALPWILKAVKTGDALALRRSTRRELARVLLELVNNGPIPATQEVGSHEKTEPTIHSAPGDNSRPSGATGTHFNDTIDSSNIQPTQQSPSSQLVVE